MKLATHDHKGGAKLIDGYLQDEVKNAIVHSPSLSRATPARENILSSLRTKHGWSDEIIVSADAKISITSRKGDFALCVQTGNMSRFYADLLKLEYLFKESSIKAAIYILPMKALASEWGENIANFERFTNELKIFSKIINTPMLAIGIPKRQVL
jgi:hypothetical protein